jgi:hypothetical protein
MASTFPPSLKLPISLVADNPPPPPANNFCRVLPKLLVLASFLALVHFALLTTMKQDSAVTERLPSTSSAPTTATNATNPAKFLQTKLPSDPLITYAVSITGCSVDAKTPGNQIKHDSHLQGLSDGSKVLKHSIERAHKNSKFKNVKFVAFVHDSAKDTPCAAILADLGFQVQAVPTPVHVPDIQLKNLRENIVKSGCCGEKELIKFYSYTLLSSAVVVHLDIDVIVLRPLDDLFQGIIGGNATAYFTKDYNMVNPGVKAGIQGGFFVVKPDGSIFKRLNEIVLTGNYSVERGWMNSGIGSFWGGMTFQGLAAYYYDKESTSGKEVSRCYYNNMVDDPKTNKGVCRDGSPKGVCEDCREMDANLVYTAHFTACSKPWKCRVGFSKKQKLCQALHTKWFEARKEFEVATGTWNASVYNGRLYGGFCTNGGDNGYLSIGSRKKSRDVFTSWILGTNT